MNSAISLDLTAFMESQVLFEDITHDVLYFIQQRIRLVNYLYILISYFCKKWRNCNLDIILKITGEAIKHILVFWKTTYCPQGEEYDLKSELSLFGDLMC